MALAAGSLAPSISPRDLLQNADSRLHAASPEHLPARPLLEALKRTPSRLVFCLICLLSLSPIAIVTLHSQHKAPSVPLAGLAAGPQRSDSRRRSRVPALPEPGVPQAAASARPEPRLQKPGQGQLGAPSLELGINGARCSGEAELAAGRICKHGLEGQQGAQRFAVTTPLLRTGESFNASGPWSSPVNSAIQGDQPTSLYPRTAALHLPASYHQDQQ